MEGLYTLEFYTGGEWVVVGKGRWSEMEALALSRGYEIGLYFINSINK